MFYYGAWQSGCISLNSQGCHFVTARLSHKQPWDGDRIKVASGHKLTNYFPVDTPLSDSGLSILRVSQLDSVLTI